MAVMVVMVVVVMKVAAAAVVVVVAPALEDSAPGNNFRKILPGALSSNECLDKCKIVFKLFQMAVMVALAVLALLFYFVL